MFFQKFHFAFIFHFPSGTDFQLIYRGVIGPYKILTRQVDYAENVFKVVISGE